MSFSVKGIVKNIVRPQTKVSNSSGKEYTIGFLLLETLDQYPQLLKFKFFNTGCDHLDLVKSIGDFVTVHFDIKGNEYQGKVYNELSGWKIDLPNNSQQPTPETSVPESSFPSSGIEDDDMPF